MASELRKQRAIMYTQQLRLLPEKDWQDAIKRIVTVTKPSHWAGIVHDKDTTEEGELVEPHLHLMLYFKHARSPQNVAWEIDGKTGKREDAKTERLEFFKQVNNGYSYLVHHTQGAKDKYQYDPSLVVSNFDYPQKLQQIEKQVKRRQNQSDNDLIADYLNQLYEGTLTLEEVEAELTGSLYAKANSRIKAVMEKRQEFLIKDYIHDMTAHNRHKVVVYIYGKSGLGKTRLAKHYAQQLQFPYFITGSSRDPFQTYRQEPLVILDELRPQTFRYDDLLKLLDPYNFEVLVPSRYYDKALTAKYLFITSPYSPLELYQEAFNGRDRTDSFEQLNRRLDTILEVTAETIFPMRYNQEMESYQPILGTEFANTFKPIRAEHQKHDSFLQTLEKLPNHEDTIPTPTTESENNNEKPN